ncbi:cell division protein FtsZ, partial [Rhizobium ruizarguesonis]
PGTLIPGMNGSEARTQFDWRRRNAGMERELEIPAPRAAAPLQQPAPQQETFRPQRKIFAPAPEAPAMRPAPVQQQDPAPVMSQQVISQ